MNTKLISNEALELIGQYKNVPYFNNKSKGRRGGLAVEVGKGSPKEIYDEVRDLGMIQKIDTKSFDNSALKKFMVDNDIGIDCSGFAYYLLNEESRSRGLGAIDKHIYPNKSSNIFSYFSKKLHPVKNTDVIVFANNANSRVISLKDAQVADFITMIGTSEEVIRNHIVVITQIEYQNFIPITLHYTHAVAWPTDGEYGHGIHEGKIEITNIEKPLIEQKWVELDKEGDENYTFARAKKSITELRRLHSFK